MNKWQPIETAPKDGTEILILCREGNMFVARWSYSGCYEYWVSNACADDCYGADDCDVSHWMKLPEPPAMEPRSN